MKIKRYKRIQKVLKFYQQFGFHSPYNILIDGTICRAALEAKVNLQEQLPKYFASSVNIVTTQCVILEVEKLSKVLKNLFGTWLVVKQYPVHHCGHKRQSIPAVECIKSLLQEKNPNRYIIATIDSDLRNYINNHVTGTPIVYLHDKCPTIEKPSQLSEENIREKDSSAHQMESLKSLKRKIIGEEPENLKKKKKKKNPNPLSCLKKKTNVTSSATSSGTKSRRRRKKKEEDINDTIKKVFEI